MTVEVTGSKEVPVKLTVHSKICVLVCLMGKANGSKCKLFIVFKGAKRESKFLHEEFKQKCSVATSTNGWMNEGLTFHEILGKYSFHKRLLAWDSYEAHLTDNVKEALSNSKIETVITGGCTR